MVLTNWLSGIAVVVGLGFGIISVSSHVSATRLSDAILLDTNRGQPKQFEAEVEVNIQCVGIPVAYDSILISSEPYLEKLQRQE